VLVGLAVALPTRFDGAAVQLPHQQWRLTQRQDDCLANGENAMTLSDLIALNDEIAALVRAGVPLEEGLAELGADMPGRMGQVAAVLAERTARGESLEDALLDQAIALPPAYRAIVQAGVRAGRLPAVLEAVAASARRTAETQRAAVVAVSYPLLVTSLVWIGTAIFCATLAPGLAVSLHALGSPVYKFFAVLASMGQWAGYWGPIVPVVFAMLLLAWWRHGASAGMLYSRTTDRIFGVLPWMGRVLQYSRSATFLDVLALLVESKMPLDEAVSLAAAASGDRETIRASRRATEMIRKGQMQPGRPLADPAFPPLMNWLVFAACRGGILVPALQHSAEAYHRRARLQSDLVRALLPAMLTILIGGTITAAYALMLFIPYITLLENLSK
jgi:type II secretory pathway component PulF